jgi:hypothetical protein
MPSLCKTQKPLKLFKFDYTKDQWWIQKYALIITSRLIKGTIKVNVLHFPLRYKILLSFIVLSLKKIIYEWNK